MSCARPLAVLLSLLAAGPSVAQTWRPVPMLRSRSLHDMAYDEARGETVMVGGWHDYLAGSEVRSVLPPGTWAWNGTGWRLAADENPSAGATFLAYDPSRAVTVLFGGGAGNETWEWDGTHWTQRLPATVPGTRWLSQSLAHDIVRQRTVLARSVGFGVPSETWEWDGNDWLLRSTGALPDYTSIAVAYDRGRGRTVLVGSALGVPAATWEWDGSSWTPHPASPGSATRYGFDLTYDPVNARVLLFGGTEGSTYSTGLWTFDGTAWTSLPVPPYPTGPWPRRDTAVAIDPVRGQLVVFGGWNGGGFSDTWEWDGATWTQREAFGHPFLQYSSAAVYDSARNVSVFGGGGSGFETAEWDGSGWDVLSPSTSPPQDIAGAMAYDRARAQTVLFGNDVQGRTWLWDGTDWQGVVPPVSPPQRGSPALAYDCERSVVVLFGGASRNDTWEWNGTTWQQRTPAHAPLRRWGHAMAYDAARGVVVLFGGALTSVSLSSDTWEWDGVDWRPCTTSGPAPRAFAGMAFHEHRGRVVLVGGLVAGTRTSSDVWEWDGSAWLRLPDTDPCDRPATAFDAAGNLVAFGKFSEDYGTRVFEIAQPAAFSAFGTGCGTQHVPELRAAPFSAPWIGTTLGLRVENLPAASPGGVLALGGSATSWMGIPLPLDLTAIGMTGCSAYTSIELVLPLAAAGGSAALSLPIPALPALVGNDAFGQAYVVDPAGTPLGVTASNGAQLRFGQL